MELPRLKGSRLWYRSGHYCPECNEAMIINIRGHQCSSINCSYMDKKCNKFYLKSNDLQGEKETMKTKQKQAITNVKDLFNQHYNTSNTFVKVGRIIMFDTVENNKHILKIIFTYEDEFETVGTCEINDLPIVSLIPSITKDIEANSIKSIIEEAHDLAYGIWEHKQNMKNQIFGTSK